MQTIALELEEKGRREGRAEGEAGLRKAIFEVLEARFGEMPEGVQTRLAELNDLTFLRQATV